MRDTGTDKLKKFIRGTALLLCMVLPVSLCACGLFPSLELTDEDAEETKEVLESFAARRKTGKETTTGHWKRPVE